MTKKKKPFDEAAYQCISLALDMNASRMEMELGGSSDYPDWHIRIVVQDHPFSKEDEEE